MPVLTKDQYSDFNITPEKLKDASKRFLSFYLCDNCHDSVSLVNNTRSKHYCSTCQPLMGLIKRATNSDYRPDVNERRRLINTNTKKTGPFWPNPEASKTKGAWRG